MQVAPSSRCAPLARLPRHFVPRNDSWWDTHARFTFLLYHSEKQRILHSGSPAYRIWNIPQLARGANITFCLSKKYHLRKAQISLSLCENITHPPIRCLPIHARNYIYYINSYFYFPNKLKGDLLSQIAFRID